MLTKTQFGACMLIGAVAWDAVQFAKLKTKYENTLKRNIEYQNTIALQKYAINGLDKINDYLSHVLDANDIQVTEFDKIAMMNLELKKD